MIALAQESLTADVLGWLSGDDFSSMDGVPQLIAEHLLLSIAALVLACVLALPLAMYLAHKGMAPILSINMANAFRAIPAFGLVLLAFVLGGFSTLLLVLVFALIGVAPIFANTYVGIRQVDPEIVDAAAGMGLTGRQQLWQVEIPLASPVMMAGVRTAAVNIVATVTLAAVVGYGGLGAPIISGLRRNLQVSPTARVLAIGGAILVALLSIASEATLGWVQRRIVPEGLQLRESAKIQKTVALEQTAGKPVTGPAVTDSI